MSDFNILIVITTERKMIECSKFDAFIRVLKSGKTKQKNRRKRKNVEAYTLQEHMRIYVNE